MKVIRGIFVALALFGTYYITTTNRVEDERSKITPSLPIPKFSDKSPENKLRLREMIKQHENNPVQDDSLEKNWDSNYIQYNPTERHYSDEDSLLGYFD